MNILWLKDNKIGHEKQVKALLNELSKTNEINIIDEDYLGGLGKFFNWPHGLFNLLTLNIIREALDEIDITKYDNRNSITRKDILNKYDIDIIIGAGHSTHSRILYLKKFFNYFKKNHKVKAISILTPSFRKNSFDLICAPLHDKNKFKPINSNVLYFEGSLCEVFDSLPNEEIGFIGLGGKNKHFSFDVENIFKQIQYVTSIYPSKDWYVFNSRRTPKTLNKLLKNYINENKIKNIFFQDSNSTEIKSYNEIISAASIKIVSQDSVNMIYESLSSQGETILFNMNYFKTNKVTEQVHRLLKHKQVGYIDEGDLTSDLKTMKIVKQQNKELFAEVEKLAYKVNKFLETE